jgi:hypothetical protein
MRTGLPFRAWALLIACLAANIAFQRTHAPSWTADYALGAPPSVAEVRAASLGENVFAGYLLNVYLQNFNVHLGQATAVADIDRRSVVRWLDLASDLDPGTGYPLLLASRHFAETGTPDGRRMMLDWVYRRFEQEPNTRWPWLVHAAFVARHGLNDNALALSYAAALRTQVTDPGAPSFVRQMEMLLRADLGEIEDARIILGELITAGQIRSPAELRFLESRLPAANLRGTTPNL